MANLSDQFLPPTNLGHVDEEMVPPDRAVADFRIAIGHDCLSKRLYMIGFAKSPLCKMCDSNEEMDAIHMARCRAFNSGSMWSR
ncbi:hypothetical protein TNCV_196391 [Trichonephila clavipes]|uniref:Uncharacterized protein n=1 Tax=Trichonephila clavipes TaxID=2585209 RepID=A0A8X7BKQ2_TRICX|nr:hypothetical protein TNCV_196391 [Trichonephila clavipes]